MKDLICLVADKNMEAALTGLLTRPAALGIRQITHEVVIHPRRDPGVFREGTDFVRPFQHKYQHGLLLLDAAWKGAPPNAQHQLNCALAKAGLGNWACAIVIDPELEIWVWSGSSQVDAAFGWSGRQPNLRSWLAQQGLWKAGDPKPQDPKKAVERALQKVGKPRSSAIYRALAQTISVNRCKDSAFLHLRQTLQNWFRATP